jgi:capsule polysaccharide modification protein KpsS
VGLSSIHHGTPVKVLGDAIYDLPGLTHQGELGDFLRSPGVVDDELYRAFRAYLEHNNQANGSFYVRLPNRRTPTGVRWFAPSALRASRRG